LMIISLKSFNLPIGKKDGTWSNPRFFFPSNAFALNALSIRGALQK
jgi:hypothetical protein